MSYSYDSLLINSIDVRRYNIIMEHGIFNTSI